MAFKDDNDIRRTYQPVTELQRKASRASSEEEKKRLQKKADRTLRRINESLGLHGGN